LEDQGGKGEESHKRKQPKKSKNLNKEESESSKREEIPIWI
jgi:hypothetical protein